MLCLKALSWSIWNDLWEWFEIHHAKDLYLYKKYISSTQIAFPLHKPPITKISIFLLKLNTKSLVWIPHASKCSLTSYLLFNSLSQESGVSYLTSNYYIFVTFSVDHLQRFQIFKHSPRWAVECKAVRLWTG